MIDLYTFGTPNGRKISIMLEELTVPYQVHSVDIRKGEQHAPDYLKINPNGKIPAIVDREGPGAQPFALFESGAILIYLAEKFGRFLSSELMARSTTIQWLMFQMAGVGPMFGQLNHFSSAAPEKIPYAIKRYTDESRRLLGVLNGHLTSREYLVNEYSIADIATYPWVASLHARMPQLTDGMQNVQGWIARIADRPAVQRGMSVP